MNRKLDIGCGKSKDPAFTGIDIFDWPGVDIVWNLEKFPWPIEDGSFDYIKINHVVEHINDQVGFFHEIHRIADDGALVHLETPHFSSSNSWADPTHVRHFSLFFTDSMMKNGYLIDATGEFELISRRVNFGAVIGSMRARVISAFMGYEKWERYAFNMPARNIYIDLRVVK